MASIPEAVIDSVKSLGLNGSSKDANGTIGDVVVKNICCVGAGYVGESLSSYLSSGVRVPLVAQCLAAGRYCYRHDNGLQKESMANFNFSRWPYRCRRRLPEPPHQGDRCRS